LRRYSAHDRVVVQDHLVDREFLNLMKMESLAVQHQAQFYSYACRNFLVVLIDLLRDQDRDRNLFQGEADTQAIIDATHQRPSGLSTESLVSLKQALEDLESDLSPTHRQVVEPRCFADFFRDVRRHRGR
jgi:hypothetical protein